MIANINIKMYQFGQCGGKKPLPTPKQIINMNKEKFVLEKNGFIEFS